MKNLLRHFVLFSLLVSFESLLFCSCGEKFSDEERDNIAHQGEFNDNLTSVVNELKAEVERLSNQVNGLQDENSSLQQETIKLKKQIDSLKSDSCIPDKSGVFEVDGLYFSRNGEVLSPLKESTSTTLRDGYGEPSSRVLEYDSKGRIKSITFLNNGRQKYVESFTYEGKKLTRHYRYRSSPTTYESTTIYEFK